MLKRLVALLTAVLLMTVVLAPAGAIAEGEKGMEDIIKIVKSKLTIPDNYSEFNYNVSNDFNKKVWYLNWNTKNGMDGGISVSVDDRGTIINYNSYKPQDYTKKKFPQVSKTEARTKAEDFVKRINPSVLSQVKFNESTQNLSVEYVYYFNYTRMVNGIPFYNNSVNVEVNTATGEVQSYNLNWTDDLVFPKTDNVISIEAAQKAYREKLGLRLVYNTKMEDKKTSVYAAYEPKYGMNYFIDALTGEKLNLEPGYYGPYAGGGMYDKMNASATQAKGEEAAPVLTPEELKAVDQVSKLITKEVAESKARAFKYLELTSDYKLQNASLSKEWSVPDTFTWYLYFEKAPSGNDKEYRSVSARLDALTGEIKGFNGDRGLLANAEGKYDEVQAKSAVEAFLKEVQAGKFSQTEYDDAVTGFITPSAEKKQAQYNFRYIRKVNGVAFPGNALSVTYDAVNGKVVSYDMAWYELAFPSVEKAVSIDTIYEKLFNEIGMELQYSVKYPDSYYRGGSGGEGAKPEVKLVYSPRKTKPLLFDAYTGIILNSDGKPYKEAKPVMYNDISGNFAEKQITALAEYGIALEGNSFKPGSSITQKDFLLLLSKTMNYYEVQPYAATDANKETDQLYSFMIREGVVKQNEKAPDSTVTKEEGVKFIIRALKYDKVADIKGIFICTFKDKDSIAPDLLGYVSIAQGLKIVSGSNGYFSPKANLSRAETAVMIYNYMQ